MKYLGANSIFIVFLLGIVSTTALLSQETENFSHDPFNSFLQKYVNDKGLVDYQGIKNDGKLLDEYLTMIRNLDPDKFEKWSRKEKMAFWINAYNAITIKGIVMNYPIEYGSVISRARFPKNSIRQIDDFWDKIFIQVMGKDISLNEIEHEILRKKYKDPRIHFVLVCAAIGCPILEDSAFYGKNLDQRLENAARAFINNPDKVRLDRDNNTLYLSSIFDWYKKDFKSSENKPQSLENYPGDLQGVIEFVTSYLPEDDKNYILKNNPGIEFLDYDWTLNDQN